MPRTARAIEAGLVYHVLNRGNGRMRLFHKDEDFAAFERVLAEYSGNGGTLTPRRSYVHGLHYTSPLTRGEIGATGRIIMSERTNSRVWAVAFLLVAATVLAAGVSPARAMYDPHHGRWLQRDPLGVRPDVPRGRVAPAKQYTDGMSVYEYVRSMPTRKLDPRGEQAGIYPAPGLRPVDLRSSLSPLADIDYYKDSCKRRLMGACANYNYKCCGPFCFSRAQCEHEAQQLCDRYLSQFRRWWQDVVAQPGIPPYQYCFDLAKIIDSFGLSTGCFTVTEAIRGSDRGHAFAAVFHACNATTTSDANFDPWYYVAGSFWWLWGYNPATEKGCPIDWPWAPETPTDKGCLDRCLGALDARGDPYRESQCKWLCGEPGYH